MPIRKVNLSSIRQIFRPDQVAQVIVDTDARGTPTMDEFYPAATRQMWDQVLVPVEKITTVTKAVPVVLRGAPGIPISPESSSIDYIEPQPVKTYDAAKAVEYNNAREAGEGAVQQWANAEIQRHLETHRKTGDALAAESLDGTITYPIFNEHGEKVDDYTVDFGSTKSFTVSEDWTADTTDLSTIHGDLLDMQRELERDGKAATDVLVGSTVFNDLLDKILAVGNDTRMAARLTDDGAIRLGSFLLREFNKEYWDPDSESYTQVISSTQVLMYDAGADWTFLRVRLDNFKMLNAFGGQALRQTPMGVVAELSKSGDAIDIFANSKPFPIPPVRAILSSDASTP